MDSNSSKVDSEDMKNSSTNNSGKYTFALNILPARLQTIQFAVFMVSSITAVQGMVVTGLLSVSMNMIEKQFNYNSVQSGSIHSTYDFLVGIGSIFAGHYGRKKKMTWMGMGALMMTFGSFLFVVPNFISPEIEVTEINKLCIPSGQNSNPVHPREVRYIYLVLFCCAYGLIGLGASPIHTLGISYIEENSKKEIYGFYLGIVYLFGSLGPAIGFLLSKPFLAIPYNLDYSKRQNLNSETWIGGWWIGYILSGILLFIVSWFTLFLPSYIISQDEDKKTPDSKLQFKSIGFLPNLVNILKNKYFMLLCIGMSFEGLVSNGMATYLPKFIEYQFNVSTGVSALLSGVLVVLGAGISIFGSGIFLKTRNWERRKLLKFVAVFSLVGSLSFFSFMIGCEEVNFLSNKKTSKDSTCSNTCECNSETFFPICVQNMTFLNPCVSGCTELESGKYKKCGCSGTEESEIGSCSTNCNLIAPFMFLSYLTMFFLFVTYIPLLKISFSVTKPEENSLAMGIQQVLVRIMFIIGPIVVGKAIDTSCIKHPSDVKGDSLNCLVYNNQMFRVNVSVLSVCIKMVGTLCYFIILIFLEGTTEIAIVEDH